MGTVAKKAMTKRVVTFYIQRNGQIDLNAVVSEAVGITEAIPMEHLAMEIGAIPLILREVTTSLATRVAQPKPRSL